MLLVMKMIIKINQTHSNRKNKFEVKVNDKLKYFAGTPWMNINMPLNSENIRQCIITTTNEEICYKSSYDIIENVSNSAIPMKWAITGEQKNRIFNICDINNNVVGRFYKQINGALDSKYILEYGQFIFNCYDVYAGKTQHISIYRDDFQIAEIVKPLARLNNLDNYYIFLLDEYSNLETILSFFTILFDYQNYSNVGQVVASKTEVKIKYTYDKNNKFYNKYWIENHFNREDILLITGKIQKDRKEASDKIKKYLKILIPSIILAWILLLGILGILFLSGKID